MKIFQVITGFTLLTLTVTAWHFWQINTFLSCAAGILGAALIMDAFANETTPTQ